MRRAFFVPFCIVLCIVLCIGGSACGTQEDGFTDDGGSSTIDGSSVDGRGSVDAGPDGSSSACGTCPGGSTCGTANGIPVCRSASGIPIFDHVFVIVMENTSDDSLQSNLDKAPFIAQLQEDWARGSDYHGVVHPSLSNYIAMTSGDVAREADGSYAACDCDPTGTQCGSEFTTICTTLYTNCACPVSSVGGADQSIADPLERAGISWADFAEDMKTPCNLDGTGAGADYAMKHVPFLYYDNISGNPSRCATHVVDYAALAPLLLPPADPPRFTYISPNLVHDMHDPITGGSNNLTNGDDWLATIVPAITDRAGHPEEFQRDLLVIVWDEDDLSGVINPDDPIPIMVISPLARSGGFVSTVRADHYRLLATFWDGLALPLPRLGNAQGVDALSEYFPPN